MSVAVKNEMRLGGRVSLSLSVVVKARENKDSFWKQTTELISMSRSGAGFYLEKKCEVGRLISLLLPMPRHLRCYDTEKELYRVWGLVQHCSPFSGGDDSLFHVGVAFVGKKPPASYSENPLQSYRIAGMSEDGTWRIVESKTDFVIRLHPRHWISLDVLLASWDDAGKLTMDETARTENISKSGAAVISNMKIDVGASVNFDSIQHNFSTLAIVRNRVISDDEQSRLHLEFINAEFPTEMLKLPNENDNFDEY